MRSTFEKPMSVRERFEEMDRFFACTGSVHTTLERLASALSRLDIDYAVIGAMALNAHAYRRDTTNIDVLVSKEGFASFLTRCHQLGFVPLADGRRRAFQDAGTDVAVDFFVCGEYPGDGKPKPVALPDPALVAVEIGGVRFVDLPTLINFELASGMTAPGRLRDLADVQDLIRILTLEEAFAERLSPYVREKFIDLLRQVRCPDPHAEDDRRRLP